jgi:hypothetical protein
MSFMFNPYPYNDMGAINHLKVSPAAEQAVMAGNDQVREKLNEIFQTGVTALDGYIGVNFAAIVAELQETSPQTTFIDVACCYKTQAELDAMLAEHLPVDLEWDPVSLFGRIFEGNLSELMDPDKLAVLRKKFAGATGPVVVYGCGSACAELRDLATTVVYYDMSPMNVVLRAKQGELRCIGDTEKRIFKDQMRHLYYVDYEVCIRLRQELFEQNRIDYYVDCNIPGEFKLIPQAALDEICQALVERPFRCKPCYCEGIWGGNYIKDRRSLPKEMRNCAWVYDLIPNEVSLIAEVGGTLLEMPFITFYRKMGVPLMGQQCVDNYHGVFPIRFNYDDTYGGGNMSTQVHPPLDYIQSHFGEPFQQDESYYVIITAGSRTYMGLKDVTDTEEFYGAVKKSEKDGSPVDFEKYVNSIVSRQGRQFMIPGGTIHSSGANQVVLEIGSWTVGSYTFKIYDYLRTDLDGTRRPIHSKHGINVIDKARRESYVREKLVPKPKLVREGEGWSEHIIGEHEKIFFQTRTLEFYDRIEDQTNNKFHVLNLVEGQRVRVESVASPDKCYELNHLDMVVVPACLGQYRIVNLGAGPVRIHKTLLKQDSPKAC